MPSHKPPKLKAHSFTNEQIRAKAYEIWQKHPERSEEENWDVAIKALQAQRVLQPFLSLWHWTGFSEKKLWDLLQLLVSVSIPIVLFLGGQYFTTQNNDKQQKLADDKAKQDTLVKYLDQMADSLKDGLLSAKPGSDKFIIAQSRTVIALQSLDRKRQHLVIQFLLASGLSKVSAQPQFDKVGNIQLRDGDRALLYQARMSKANLENSDLSGGDMIRVDLNKANLDCIPRERKDPSQCSDLSGSNLSGASLVDASLVGANLNSANLSAANLRFAHLSGANLSAANLRSAQLGGANLSAANLRFAHLSGANLSAANLSGANLGKADLGSAQLVDTNFSGANLRGTNFSKADLSGTNFSGADLGRADLRFAILLATDLRQAKSLAQEQLAGKELPLLCHVVLPKGFTVNPKRDCDQLPQALIKRYPQNFPTLNDAKQYVALLGKLKKP